MSRTVPLNLNKAEFRIAEETFTCDECGKEIAKGRPYLIERTLTYDQNKKLSLMEHLQCMTICSMQPDARKYDVDARTATEEAVYPRCWDTASPKGQTNARIITTRRGVLVATGYSYTLEWTNHVTGKRNRFVEVPPEKIVKSNFQRTRSYDDPMGERWRSWVTTDGVVVREYLTDHCDCRAEHWYLPPAVVELEASVKPV